MAEAFSETCVFSRRYGVRANPCGCLHAFRVKARHIARTPLSGSLFYAAELAGVLFKKYFLKQAITQTAVPGLSLLPSAGLGGELKIFMERQAPGEPFCMRDLTADIAAQGFRFCVMELSPAFGTFEGETVTACDEVITPVMPDPFSIDGLQIFAVNLEDARRTLHSQKPALELAGLDMKGALEAVKKAGMPIAEAGGTPAGEEGEGKTVKFVNLRFREADYKRIGHLAVTAGMTKAAFCKMASLYVAEMAAAGGFSISGGGIKKVRFGFNRALL